MSSCAQLHQAIPAKKAYQHIGQNIVVKGKMVSAGNSSYAQYSWFFIGADSAHKQLEVRIQGKLYTEYPGKIAFRDCLGKMIEIKGTVVGENKNILLLASDTIKLVK